MEDMFGDLPTLETDRLLLRKLDLGDAEDIFEYARDPEVARYVLWEAHRSIEDSQSFINWVLEQYKKGQVSPWGIVHEADEKLIGTCGFVGWFPECARAEVGYALAKKYWGKGYMSEAVRAVITFGFREMRLNRIEATCDLKNLASARVMEEVGMKFEGVLRGYILLKGASCDQKMYSLLRSEFAPG